MLFAEEALVLPFYTARTFCGLRMAVNSMCLDSKSGSMVLLRCYCNEIKKEQH